MIRDAKQVAMNFYFAKRVCYHDYHNFPPLKKIKSYDSYFGFVFLVWSFLDNAESADDVTSGSEELPSLPDFFSHKHFMLYGEIDSKTRRLMIRYITAYNG